MTVLALAGGVGGAKLANGLAAILPPGQLVVVVNTGDDFEHMGLGISPDIDTVLYTLAGINNRELGWGQQDESWAFMGAVAKLGGEAWFRLGDRDLATHVLRGQRLRAGETLSAVTADFAARLGIRQTIVPMSDDPVRSMVDTDEGELPFQDYFVRRQCQPRFRSIRFDGVDAARPSMGLIATLEDPALEAIILCPSNPLLSIAPILALPGIADRLAARRVPCIAVSPFIAGKAVKGPAAKIMGELGLPTTPSAITNHYGALLDGLIIDAGDADLAPAIPETLAVPTLMRDDADQARLASDALAMARRIGPRRAR
jgi:LPPG:FO 2-phospho-L-lactate transferase